jgi:ssDNA-binding Zn-finger/Zn-ribbon topoisomerase 1
MTEQLTKSPETVSKGSVSNENRTLIALRDCPLCGNMALLKKSKSKAGGYIVKCETFECSTIKSGNTQTAAIKKWNVRALA